ncbi:hypothetical protein AMJ80_03025 [bacterium SM23_31]|nr:MAG: hypothetical protein AMJ80_03025 [bacterium SM23_31]
MNGDNILKKCANFIWFAVLLSAVFLFDICSAQQEITSNTKELQENIMAKLTGKAEISPDILLPNRFSLENRKTVRSYLVNLFKEFGYDPLTHAYSDEGENIYAVLESTVPSDEYVVLGAHYDTVQECPGANDNATGVVIVMTIAKTLRQLENRSKNFIFVLFDQEERGMRGSRAFAQKLKDENKNVHSVHTIDQMGWDEDGDRAFELEIPYEGAVELYEEAVRLQGKTLKIHTTNERGSDHSSFRRLEFKAVGITEEYRNSDTTPHIHKPTDTYETINFDYLLSTTLIVEEAMKILVR